MSEHNKKLPSAADVRGVFKLKERSECVHCGAPRDFNKQFSDALKVINDQREELDRLRAASKLEHFSVYPEQSEKINAWMNSRRDRYEGAIGGRFTYTFTPTTIGVIIKVVDGFTKEELDVTDYESF